MARRFTTIPGLGRCTIVLEGQDALQRKRVRLAYHVATRRVFLLGAFGYDNLPTPVTQFRTCELLERLCAYEWWLPLGPIEDEGDED